MPQAFFKKPFNFTPKGEGFSLRIKADKAPQKFPQRVIDAAVKEGAATEFAPEKPEKPK